MHRVDDPGNASWVRLFQRRSHHRSESGALALDGAKAVYQTIKECLLLVLFAVVDANAARMVPQFGGDEEKP